MTTDPAAEPATSEPPGPARRTLTRRPRRPMAAQAAHERRRRVVEMALGILVPIGLLLVWQLAAGQDWIDARIYPAPSEIFDRAVELAREGRLWDDVWASSRAILIGFVLGVAGGFAAGAAMGVSRLARASFEPLLTGLYVVPKLALLPILLTVFGFGESSKIALVAITVFFFIWIDTMVSFATVPEGYREAARSLNMSRTGMFVHVLVPAALPKFFVAMRVSIGVAVLITVASEFVVGNEGLGYLIFNSRQLGIYGWMYAGIITVALEGVFLAQLISLIGRRLTPWEEKH